MEPEMILIPALRALLRLPPHVRAYMGSKRNSAASAAAQFRAFSPGVNLGESATGTKHPPRVGQTQGKTSERS